MMRYIYRCQAGFTLVELMLVILVMSGLAMVATAFVDNAHQQMGFDQTKAKLEQIRRAIIGDSSRTINGQPEISGFVADMGRLPENLNELIEKPASAQAWHSENIDFNATTVGQLYGGWRGPYLEAMPESTGVRAFRDGWGNVGSENPAADDFDGTNYGWIFKKEDDPATTNIDEAAYISVQSMGADLEPGPIEEGEDSYDQDFPTSGNLVNEHDWRVDVRNQPVQVEINRSATTADSLRLEIYRLENGTLATLEIPLTSTSLGVANQTITGNFAANQYLPIGTYAVAVVCVPMPPATPTLYGGDCTIAGTPPPIQYFKIISRSHQLPLQITWNTQ